MARCTELRPEKTTAQDKVNHLPRIDVLARGDVAPEKTDAPQVLSGGEHWSRRSSKRRLLPEDEVDADLRPEHKPVEEKILSWNGWSKLFFS
jgi:hypothetical protein